MSKSRKARHGTKTKLWKDTVYDSRCQVKAFAKKKRRRARKERRARDIEREETVQVMDVAEHLRRHQQIDELNRFADKQESELKAAWKRIEELERWKREQQQALVHLSCVLMECGLVKSSKDNCIEVACEAARRLAQVQKNREGHGRRGSGGRKPPLPPGWQWTIHSEFNVPVACLMTTDIDCFVYVHQGSVCISASNASTSCAPLEVVSAVLKVSP